MKKTSLLLVVFGIVVILGGALGYIRKNSTMSLIMGISSGVLLLASSYLVLKKPRLGLLAGLFLSFILEGFFAYKFFATGKVFPAGIMGLISLIVLITLAFTLRRTTRV